MIDPSLVLTSESNPESNSVAANCSDPNNRYVNGISASVGIKEVHLKWPDGKTSWIEPAKLNFEVLRGIWTLEGGKVNVT